MPPYNHTRWQRAFGQPSDSVALAPAAGPPFHLVSRPGGAVTATEQGVFTGAMTIARNRLARTYAVMVAKIAGTPLGAGLVPASFDDFFHFCFRLAPGMPGFPAALITVRDNIVRIRNGLWDPALQIVDSNPSRGGLAPGYVRCSFSESLRRRDPAREESFAGRIHIRFATFNTAVTPVNQRNAGLTIVHEGAHRFCGTRDWLYNSSGGVAHINFLALGFAPPLPPLTPQQALNNADSYAELVCNLP